MSQDVKEDLDEISQNSTMDLIEEKLSNLLKESLHGDLLTQQKLDHAAQPLPTKHFDNDPGFRSPPKLDAASQIVAEFLLEKEPEFFRVTEFRNRVSRCVSMSESDSDNSLGMDGQQSRRRRVLQETTRQRR